MSFASEPTTSTDVVVWHDERRHQPSAARAADPGAYYTCPHVPGDPISHEYNGLTYVGE